MLNIFMQNCVCLHRFIVIFCRCTMSKNDHVSLIFNDAASIATANVSTDIVDITAAAIICCSYYMLLLLYANAIIC